jgi:hypothetical protein
MIATAQNEYTILWDTSVGSDASITIEPGDTVTWIWNDGLPHSVTSGGGATEAFDSGTESPPFTFSYTFLEIGVNPYSCLVHPGMAGTITVEQVASVEDNFRESIKYYPNPVQDKLMVTSLYQLDSYTVYNVLGKEVLRGTVNGNITEISMSELQSGIYFVNAVSGEMQTSFKITKN